MLRAEIIDIEASAQQLFGLPPKVIHESGFIEAPIIFGFDYFRFAAITLPEPPDGFLRLLSSIRFCHYDAAHITVAQLPTYNAACSGAIVSPHLMGVSY